MSDRECGNCKWWSFNPELAQRTNQNIGDCKWTFEFPETLPSSSVYKGFDTYCMLSNEGQDCPVYEAQGARHE